MTPFSVLVVDTASPVVSLAIARQGEILASATLELRKSSERLLITVEELLESADCRLRDLSGVAALQGPGSFTGLRIGLATVLGWHQALGLPATALPTLPILALAGGPPSDVARTSNGGEMIAAVNAMRGDWMVQRFQLPETAGQWPTPLDDARLLAFDAFHTLEALPIVGFEMPEQQDLDLRPAQPLAPIAARLLSTTDPTSTDPTPTEPTDVAETPLWQAGKLMQPIYFRPPAVTLPKSKTAAKAATRSP